MYLLLLLHTAGSLLFPVPCNPARRFLRRAVNYIYLQKDSDQGYHDGGFNSKVNLIMGDTYGSAYVAMGARSISDADMVFAWDDAKVGMMEAEKAANILFAAEGEKATEKQAAAYEGKQNAVTSAAARGSVDAVIAPAQTRKHLIMAFSML